MIDQVLAQLRTAEITLYVADGRLRYRATPGVYTTELRNLVRQHRDALLGWFKAEDLGAMPTESRPRALWLAAMARRAGYDAEALMVLIDETIGYRSTGPFELTTSETKVIADALRSRIGMRPAIGSATVASDMPVAAAVPTSIRRKVELGWSDSRFSALCLRILGHPGLRSREDDKRILVAINHSMGGKP